VDALQHTPDTAPTPPATSTDLSQAVEVLSLLENGFTVAEAAERLGLSRRTAFRRLDLVEVDNAGVVKLLNAKRLDLTEDMIRASKVAADKGDHRAALAALLHARALDPVNDGSQGRMQVAIMIGTPEQPIRLSPPQQVLEPE
jgi:hypothetical protein